MSWLLVALIPPALYAVTSYIDKYLVSGRYGKQPLRTLMGFNVLAQVVGAGVLVFAIGAGPIIDVLGTFEFWLAFLGGVLIVCYIPLYYRAMMLANTSIVSPFFQLIPLFVLVLGVLFLGEVPTLLQIAGMGFLIAGAAGLSFEDRIDFRTINTRLVVLMFIATFLIAASLVIFKNATETLSYSVALATSAFGGVAATLVIWLSLPKTKTIYDLPRRHRWEFAGWEFLNELVDRGAEWILRYATTIGPIALVQAVNGIQPLITLLYGAVLAFLVPSVFAHERGSWNMRVILSIIVIVVGAVLVTFETVG